MAENIETDFEAFRNNYNDDKITLLNPSAIWKNRKKLDRKTVVLKGEFITDYNYTEGKPLDLQACSTNALIIDEGYLEDSF